MSETLHPSRRDPAAPVAKSDSSVLWSDARLLGYQPMDAVHEEFYDVTLGLLACTDETAAAALQAFAEHAQSHFDQEDEWMRSTAFPPRDCHIDEHAAVLKSVHEVTAQVASGEAGADLVHSLGRELFAWFPGHADYLDSALAAWMTKQTMGGKPIVIRRNAASAS